MKRASLAFAVLMIAAGVVIVVDAVIRAVGFVTGG